MAEFGEPRLECGLFAALVSRVHTVRRIAMNQDTVHELHREAARQHELAAHSHRTASEHNEKGDHETAFWHAERALEYASRAYQVAQDAHNKSGQIRTL